MRADGTVETAARPGRGQAGDRAGAQADGIDAVAIVFMHAWKYPEHEKAVAKVCRKAGFAQVSVSHEVSPLIKLVGRGDTTVVDAYLSPILSRYVQQVAGELGDDSPSPTGGEIGQCTPACMFMMSSGGLTAADLFQGKDAHPVRPGRRRGRHGRDGATGRLRPGHRLRHGRHLDRRRAL